MNISTSETIRIFTNWRRFSSGLWRVPEGDIAAAYSADTMPKVAVFVHEGRWYTNGGACHSKWVHSEVYAYQLINPDEYHGLVSASYSYEGKLVTHKGQPYRLGPKTLFVATDPTVGEWRRLLRTLFADGGYFASDCDYPQFLNERCRPESENGRVAHGQELADFAAGQLPRTKEAMTELLNLGEQTSENTQQLAFQL